MALYKCLLAYYCIIIIIIIYTCNSGLHLHVNNYDLTRWCTGNFCNTLSRLLHARIHCTLCTIHVHVTNCLCITQFQSAAALWTFRFFMGINYFNESFHKHYNFLPIEYLQAYYLLKWVEKWWLWMRLIILHQLILAAPLRIFVGFKIFHNALR